MRISQEGDASAHDHHSSVGHGDNVITDVLISCQEFLQAYGWHIVLGALALYLLQPYLHRLRAEISLRRANNPTRRKILDEERKRVRLRQQIDHLRSKEKAQCDEENNEKGKDSDTETSPPNTSLKKRPVKKKRVTKVPEAS